MFSFGLELALLGAMLYESRTVVLCGLDQTKVLGLNSDGATCSVANLWCVADDNCCSEY